MVKETIEGIRETEKQADAIVKGAQAQCQQIIEEATTKAKKCKENQIAAFKKLAEEKINEAKRQGDFKKEQADAKVGNEVEAIRYLAKQKEDEIVDSVLHSFV